MLALLLSVLLLGVLMSVLMIGMKNVLARLALNKTFFFLCQRPAFGLDLKKKKC